MSLMLPDSVQKERRVEFRGNEFAELNTVIGPKNIRIVTTLKYLHTVGICVLGPELPQLLASTSFDRSKSEFCC